MTESTKIRNNFTRLSILFAFIISILRVNAQQSEVLKCGSLDPPKDYYESSKLFLQNSDQLRDQIKSPISVALSVKMTRKSDGSGGMSKSVVESAIANLNSKFFGSNISFFLYKDEITYIDEDKYYTFSSDDEDELTEIYDVDNAVNLYLVHSFAESIGGYAYFPSTDKSTNRVFSYYQSESDFIEKVLPHEFGHYFGLFHTFQGNGSTFEEYVTRGQFSNCDYSGDLLCDTPADPYGRLYIIGYFNCDYPYTFSDRLGEQYRPATDNLMSYYRGCGNNFTIGQTDLMAYGISKRLATNSESSRSYDIRGFSPATQATLVTRHVKSQNNELTEEDLCSSERYLLEFNSSLDSNIVIEAYVLSSDYKVRHLVGSGTKSPIEIDLSTVPKLFSNFSFQVVTEDEKNFGSLGPRSHSLLDIPNGKLSGEFSIFSGESGSYILEVEGGKASYELIDQDGKIYQERKDFRINKIHSLTVSKTSELSVKSIKNSCGNGTVEGIAKIIVTDAPPASLVSLNSPDLVWCKDQVKTISIVANGTPPKVKNLGIYATANNTKIEGFQYELNFDKLTFQPLNERDDLPKEVYIEIEFENIPEKIKSKTFYFAEPIKYARSAQLETGRLEEVSVRLDNTFFASPTELIFNETILKTVVGSSPSISFTSLENQNFILSNVINGTCQKIDLSIDIELKIKENLRLEVVRKTNSCPGELLKVAINKSQAFVNNNPEILFYNELDKNIGLTSGKIDGNNLSFEIPESLKKEGYYYFRVKTLEGFLSEKSNKFFISTFPSVDISGFYNNSYANKSIIKSLEGTFPMTLKFSNGVETKLSKKDEILPFTLFPEGRFSLESVSNSCGSKSPKKEFEVSRSTLAANCTPIRLTGDASGGITRFTIKESNGKEVNKLVGDRFGTGAYNDFTNSIIYLNKNKKYDIEASTWTQRTRTGGGGGNGEIVNIWIDYNKNGSFENNERIDVNGYQYYFSLQINNSITSGYYLMRITSNNDREKPEFDPCSSSETIGVTSDYTVKIADENIGDIPRLQVNITNKSICKGSPIFFSIQKEGSIINNEVNVSLLDKWGNQIQNFGELEFGTHSKNIDYELFDNEANMTLEVFDPKSGIRVNSEEFFIIQPPIISLSGTSFGTKGKSTLVTYKLIGGSEIDLTYSINGKENTSTFSSYGSSIYLRSFSDKFDYSQLVRPIKAVDKVCGNAQISGSTQVTLVENNDFSVEDLRVSEKGGYSSCQNGFSRNYSKTDVVNFGPNNYLTAHLVDSKGNYNSTLGYFKAQEFSIESFKKEVFDMYYVKFISSEPVFEDYGYSQDAFFKNNVVLNNPQKTFEGDLTFIEINPSYAFTSLNVSNSGYDYKLTNNIRLPFIPNSNTPISITSSPRNFCSANFAALAYINEPIANKKGEIAIRSPQTACIGGTIDLPFFTNKKMESNNKYEFEILNEANEVVEKGTSVPLSGNFKISQRQDLLPNKKYRIRINSTNPYIESELTQEISFSPRLEAELTSNSKSDIYSGTKIPIKVSFTGEKPYSFSLNSGQNFEDIRDSIFNTTIDADINFPKVFISKLSSTCGNGNVKGEVNLNIFEVPSISIAPIGSEVLCIGKNLELNYATTKGKFIDEPNLILELVTTRTGESQFLKSLPSSAGSVSIVIPTFLNKAEKYQFRIANINPYFNSIPTTAFTVDDIPKATILKDISGFEGLGYDVEVQIESGSPVKIVLNGEEYITSGDYFKRNIVLSNSLEAFRIDQVSNFCGIGKIDKNQATISLLPLEEAGNFARIYPNPLPYKSSDLGYLLGLPLSENEFDVFVLNSKGQVVFENEISTINGFRSKYKFPELPIGLYFVNITKGNLKIVKKLIIK